MCLKFNLHNTFVTVFLFYISLDVVEMPRINLLEVIIPPSGGWLLHFPFMSAIMVAFSTWPNFEGLPVLALSLSDVLLLLHHLQTHLPDLPSSSPISSFVLTFFRRHCLASPLPIFQTTVVFLRHHIAMRWGLRTYSNSSNVHCLSVQEKNN